jgi:hypothetical protein
MAWFFVSRGGRLRRLWGERGKASSAVSLAGLAMAGSPVYPVPPGSSVLRQLCQAVLDAVTLSRPAAERDELTYLRICRDRNRQVAAAMRRLLHDWENDDRDVMAMVVSLREHVAAVPDDRYDHVPLPTAEIPGDDHDLEPS